MGFWDGAKARAAAAATWVKEQRERGAARKAERNARRDAEAIASASAVFVLPREYVDGARWVSYIATTAVLFFLFLYSLDEAKDSVVTALLTRLGLWRGHAEFAIPLLVGFLLISAAVALYCKHWVVAFTQLRWRGKRDEGWIKTIALVLGLLTSGVVVMGTFTLTQGGRIDAHRPEVEAVQRHEAEVAAARGRLEAIEADLREALGPENLARPSTQMQACRNTEVTWRVRISNTPADDWQRPQIVRAISDAIRCDQLRASRLEAQGALRVLESQVVGRAVVERDAGVAGAVDLVRNIRGALLALTCDLLAIWSTLLAVALERVRQRQLAERAAATGNPLKTDDKPTAEEEDIAPRPNKADDPLDPPLELPPLPDLRGVEDPAFDALSATVDEEGRVLRKFSGWRAPRARNDKRRAPEPDADTMAMADIDAAAADEPAAAAIEDDTADAADWVRAQAQQQETENAK